jgi:endogenous inhibitor of DNA gyrase (YacG/DUF329 family)
MKPTGTPPSPATQRVTCPTCGGDSVFAPSNPSRPFCSERCKNIDLGAWASEDFRMPVNGLPEDLLTDDKQ